MVATTAQGGKPALLVCPWCQASEYSTTWTTSRGEKRVAANCIRCGQFIAFLPLAEAKLERAAHEEMQTPSHRPPPNDWEWIGWVRPADGTWRAVALSKTLGACWDSLLHVPLDGDRIAIPVMPGGQVEGEVSP